MGTYPIPFGTAVAWLRWTFRGGSRVGGGWVSVRGSGRRVGEVARSINGDAFGR